MYDTARSPVFSHLSATLTGLSTVRAFKTQQRFTDDFDRYQDNHTQGWFLFLATTRWLGVQLDSFVVLFICGVSFTSVLAFDRKSIQTLTVTGYNSKTSQGQSRSNYVLFRKHHFTKRNKEHVRLRKSSEFVCASRSNYCWFLYSLLVYGISRESRTTSLLPQLFHTMETRQVPHMELKVQCS